MQQARRWEESGEYEKAVDCYLRVDQSHGSAPVALGKASELAIKFLDTDKALEVAEVVGPRLVAAGKYAQAAQLYLGVEMIKEAIDAFLEAQEWTKARKVARELEPRLEPYVEQRYKDHLQNQGHLEELVNVDLERALNMLAGQGNWTKAIETAGEHGAELQHKYVAHYATELIHDGRPLDALNLYKASR
jgi:intraflagellar transport protein 172